MDSCEIKIEPEEYNKTPSQICRLCLSEETLDDIFQDDSLHQLISDYLSLKVSTQDRMSQLICTICRLRLTEFHEFRIHCQEVQLMLQSMIPTECVGMEKSASDCGNDLPPAKKSRGRNLKAEPLPCEVCLKVFTTNKARRDHKKVHGPRKYSCMHCEKSFTTRYKLKRHSVVHAAFNPKDYKPPKSGRTVPRKCKTGSDEDTDDCSLTSDRRKTESTSVPEPIAEWGHTRSNDRFEHKSTAVQEKEPESIQNENGDIDRRVLDDTRKTGQSIGIENMVDVEVKLEAIEDDYVDEPI